MQDVYNGHDFILIPEGVSPFGSAMHDPNASLKERPFREVFVSEFRISKHPTTYKQFANFLIENKLDLPAHWGEGDESGFPLAIQSIWDFPVTNISWETAQSYCSWLSKITKEHVVLPTEAEWEKAARGYEPRIWPWGNEFNPELCASKEGFNRFCSVFDLEEGASPYGCHHMSGNVWEWCEDYWHHNSHLNTGLVNPVNFVPSERRVVKGGSAFCTKEIVRPACRDWTNSFNQGGGDDGFRVAIRAWRT